MRTHAMRLPRLAIAALALLGALASLLPPFPGAPRAAGAGGNASSARWEWTVNADGGGTYTDEYGRAVTYQDHVAIAGSATVERRPDGSVVVSPFNLSVIHEIDDTRVSGCQTRHNTYSISDSTRYDTAFDPYFAQGDALTVYTGTDGRDYLSNPFERLWFSVKDQGAGRVFTYNHTEIKTICGTTTRTDDTAQALYYTSIFNGGTAYDLPADETGLNFARSYQYERDTSRNIAGFDHPMTVKVRLAATIVRAGTAPSPSPTPSPSPSSPPPSSAPSPQPDCAGTRSLTVTTDGAGSVAPGSGDRRACEVVTLAAAPAAGQLFTGWTIDGQPAGWANPLTMTMDRDHAVRAAFAPRPTFADVGPDTPYVEAIAQLAARGIIHGYADGRFGPADHTLRAQMAALICRALGWDAEDWGTPFPDRGATDPDLWRNVGALAHYGVARGYAGGSYDPTGDVLAAQTISFIARAMVARGYWQQQPDDPALYPNVPANSGHRQDLATFVHYTGVVPGTASAGGAWGWYDQPGTRSWFAEALWRALDSALRADRTP